MASRRARIPGGLSTAPADFRRRVIAQLGGKSPATADFGACLWVVTESASYKRQQHYDVFPMWQVICKTCLKTFIAERRLAGRRLSPNHDKFLRLICPNCRQKNDYGVNDVSRAAFLAGVDGASLRHTPKFKR